MDGEIRHLNGAEQEAIRLAVEKILLVLDMHTPIGGGVGREVLENTPKRVVGMIDEMLAGMRYSNDEIAQMFDKCFDEPDYEDNSHDMVLMKDIDAFSYCEHHLALMYNMKVAVAYIPCGKVIGLSKIARVVDMVCRRLQLQERIAADIAEVMMKILGTDDIMVVVTGEHSCMTARGIKKPGTATTGVLTRGVFAEDCERRNEVYNLIRNN